MTVLESGAFEGIANIDPYMIKMDVIIIEILMTVNSNKPINI